MHAAWRKRAEEAEKERDALKVLLREVVDAIEQSDTIEMYRRLGDGLMDKLRHEAKGENEHP